MADAVMIKRNVMIPIVLPVTKGDSSRSCNASRRKVNVIRARKYRALPTTPRPDSAARSPNARGSDSETASIKVDASKRRIANPALSQQNSTALEKYLRTRHLQRVRDKPGLTFPNTISPAKALSFASEGCDSFAKSVSCPLTAQSSRTDRRRANCNGLRSSRSKSSHFCKQSTTRLRAQTMADDELSKNVSETTDKEREFSSYAEFKANYEKVRRAAADNDVENISRSANAEPEVTLLSYGRTDDAEQSSHAALKSDREETESTLHLALEEREIKSFDYEKANEFDLSRENDFKWSIGSSNDKFQYASSGTDRRDSPEIKYSWQDVTNWVPPSQKRKMKLYGDKNEYFGSSDKGRYECKVKYSWQIIGTSTQTSRVLLQDLDPARERVDEIERIDRSTPRDFGRDEQNFKCQTKYSWQIIGVGAQVSSTDNGDFAVASGANHGGENVLIPRKYEMKDVWRDSTARGNGWLDVFNDNDKKSRGYIVFRSILMNNEATQTLVDEENQTEFTDCKVSYSWQHLIRRHLEPEGCLRSTASRESASLQKCASQDRVEIGANDC